MGKALCRILRTTYRCCSGTMTQGLTRPGASLRESSLAYFGRENSVGGNAVSQMFGQHQKAFLSAYKRPPTDEDAEEPEDLQTKATHGHLRRVSSSELRHKIEPLSSLEVAAIKELDQERRDDIRKLLKNASEEDNNVSNATEFAESFFLKRGKVFEKMVAPNQDTKDSVDKRPSVDKPVPTAKSSRTSDIDSKKRQSGPSRSVEQAVDTKTTGAIDKAQESKVLQQLKGLRRGSQRIVLQRLLQGGMLEADPEAMEEWQTIQESFKAPSGFRMKVVNVNRTCKGTRSGGMYRFSTMVVVGNGEGVLGWGQGKAAEVAIAVRKAFERACQNLYPVPRYNEHTIPERVEAKFGKIKVIMYPKSAGRGIVASKLVNEICKLAGIHDIGVKIYGSRNPINTVKCVFEGFASLRTHEEILNTRKDGKLVLAVAPGRFGKISI